MTFEDIQRANQAMAMVDIKGKEYATVNQRVKAFRMVHPGGSTQTEIISLADGIVVMKATVCDEDGRVLATGYAREKESSSFINKTSFIENCETSALGRALGFCGFGIDTSIASYEEVETATVNQNKATFDQLAIIKEAIKASGYPVQMFLKKWNEKYGVQSLEDLTKEYANEIIESINARETRFIREE